MKRHAFTLIELLAVVAIILILAALLIPAVAVVLEQARSIICRNNMKALQTGFNLRSTDRDGQMARGSTTWTNGMTDEQLPWSWHQDFTTNSTVWPYVNEKRVYACPSYPSPGRDLLKRHYSVSGFINSEGAGWGALYTAVAMSQVRQPSKTHVMIEEYDQRSDTPSASWPNAGCQGSFVVGYGSTPVLQGQLGGYADVLAQLGRLFLLPGRTRRVPQVEGRPHEDGQCVHLGPHQLRRGLAVLVPRGCRRLFLHHGRCHQRVRAMTGRRLIASGLLLGLVACSPRPVRSSGDLAQSEGRDV
jgi:prepilin-type N-terminal cleavage/methylation domain-containing protein